MKPAWSRDWAVFIALLSAILYLGYGVDRSDFLNVLLGYSVSFAAFFHFVERKKELSSRQIWIFALILRLVLLFSIPKLSDDYFRFIWDGLVQWEGMSPFAHLPSDIQNEEWSVIYEGLNSKDYYSVYPPVMQLIFLISTGISGSHILGNLVIQRIFIITADVMLIGVGIKLLKLLDRKASDILFFALNPLVIIECTGNLHYESMMMAFTILGVYWLVYKDMKNGMGDRIIQSLALALGILTKLTSALAIPSLLRRSGLVRTLWIAIPITLMVCLAFWPFLDVHAIENMNSSLSLYFRNFQFNSSIYHVVDYVTSSWIPHYRAELIGPWITLSGMLLMGLVICLRKAENWRSYMETLLFILSIYLFFSSTVHPWYIVNLISVSLFTRFRYPVLWSFTAVLSYQFYGLGWESPFLLALEYLPVIAYALWEFRFKPNQPAVFQGS